MNKTPVGMELPQMSMMEEIREILSRVIHIEAELAATNAAISVLAEKLSANDLQILLERTAETRETHLLKTVFSLRSRFDPKIDDDLQIS